MLHGCWVEPSERYTFLPSLDHVVKTRKINDIKITLETEIDYVSVRVCECDRQGEGEGERAKKKERERAREMRLT